MTSFKNELSKEIFESTYKYNDETVDQMFYRIAENLASVENDTWKEYYIEKFYETLIDFKFIPGGRILSNAGTAYKSTSYINCFVSGFTGEDQDSMESISAELGRQALILKSEGGYGFCCSTLRPRGEQIAGIGGSSPGMVEFLKMWDTQSSVITKGSGIAVTDGKKKIRKGAQMVTAFIWHPDIEEFITAKQIPETLTKFNMSVLLTDKFLKAVENNDNWELVFPDIVFDKPKYKKEWNGDIEKWINSGGTVKVYKTLPAVELYDLIMQSTYNRAEPGCLFIDTVNRMNNLCSIETINSSNPCGEQPLPIGGSCLLGSINLTQFINSSKTGWDFDKLNKYLPYIVRMLDNVIELTYLPLEDQYKELKSKRRIGIGATGLGSALMLLRIPYGSPEALKLIEEYFEFVTNKIYQVSSDLSKEKGCFTLWNFSNFLEGGFHKILSPETIQKIEQQGLRNSHLVSMQPTGNTGIFANNISGGIEPVFLPEYTRTHGIDVLPFGLPTQDKWELVVKEGDVLYKFIEFNGTRYKWSQNTGYLKETLVEDYAVSCLKENQSWRSDWDYAKTTEHLTVSEHLETMKIISKYVDAAMSKTINLPNDYSYDDFKNLYLEAWKTGTIKGLTSYRAGTMSAILKKTTDNNINVKRPNELECKVIQFKNEKKDWVAFVGILDGFPHEIFSGPKDLDVFPIPNSVEHGFIIKVKQSEGESRYDFRYIDSYGYTNTLGGLSRIFDKEYWNYGRLVSALLRNKTPIEQVVKVIGGLSFTNKGMNNWKSGIIRALKSFIPDGTNVLGETCENCGSHNLAYQEGCKICLDCNTPHCG